MPRLIKIFSTRYKIGGNWVSGKSIQHRGQFETFIFIPLHRWIQPILDGEQRSEYSSRAIRNKVPSRFWNFELALRYL